MRDEANFPDDDPRGPFNRCGPIVSAMTWPGIGLIRVKFAPIPEGLSDEERADMEAARRNVMAIVNENYLRQAEERDGPRAKTRLGRWWQDLRELIASQREDARDERLREQERRLNEEMEREIAERRG